MASLPEVIDDVPPRAAWPRVICPHCDWQFRAWGEPADLVRDFQQRVFAHIRQHHREHVESDIAQFVALNGHPPSE